MVSFNTYSRVVHRFLLFGVAFHVLWPFLRPTWHFFTRVDLQSLFHLWVHFGSIGKMLGISYALWFPACHGMFSGTARAYSLDHPLRKLLVFFTTHPRFLRCGLTAPGLLPMFLGSHRRSLIARRYTAMAVPVAFVALLSITTNISFWKAEALKILYLGFLELVALPYFVYFSVPTGATTLQGTDRNLGALRNVARERYEEEISPEELVTSSGNAYRSEHPLAAARRRRFIRHTEKMSNVTGPRRRWYEQGHSTATSRRRLRGYLGHHWPRDLEAGEARSDEFVTRSVTGQIIERPRWVLVYTDTVEYQENVSSEVAACFLATGSPPALSIYGWTLQDTAGRADEGMYRFDENGDFEYIIGPTSSYRHKLWDVTTLPDRVICRGEGFSIVYEPMLTHLGGSRVALWLEPTAVLSGLRSAQFETTLWRRYEPLILEETEAGVPATVIMTFLHPSMGAYVAMSMLRDPRSITIELPSYGTLGFLSRAKRSGAQVALTRTTVQRETTAERAMAGIIATLGEREQWPRPREEYRVFPHTKPAEIVEIRSDEADEEGEAGARTVVYGEDDADPHEPPRPLGMSTGVNAGLNVCIATAGRDAETIGVGERVAMVNEKARAALSAKSLNHLRKMRVLMTSKFPKGALRPLPLEDAELKRVQRASQRKQADEEAFDVQDEENTKYFLKNEKIGMKSDGPAAVRGISDFQLHSIRWGTYTGAVADFLFKKFHFYGFKRSTRDLDDHLAELTAHHRQLIVSDYSKFDGTNTDPLREEELEIYLHLFPEEYHDEIRGLHAETCDTTLVTRTGVNVSSLGSRLSGEAGTSTGNTVVNVLATLHALVSSRSAWCRPEVTTPREAFEAAWGCLLIYGGDDGVTWSPLNPKFMNDRSKKNRLLKTLQERYAGIGLTAKVFYREPEEPYDFLGRYRFQGAAASVATPSRLLASLSHSTKSEKSVLAKLRTEDRDAAKCAVALLKIGAYLTTESDPLYLDLLRNGEALAKAYLHGRNVPELGFEKTAESAWREFMVSGGPAQCEPELLSAVIAKEDEGIYDTLMDMARAETWEGWCNPTPAQPTVKMVGARVLGDPGGGGPDTGRVKKSGAALRRHREAAKRRQGKKRPKAPRRKDAGAGPANLILDH